MKKAHRPERRFITDAKDLPSIEKLGPLESLLGTWKTPGWPCGKGDEKPGPEGPHATGWNMIALPFDEAEFNYRVLMNQYCEELHFGFVDDNVPNRGLAGIVNDGDETDQFVYTIDYLQKIHQVAATDLPGSSEPQGAGRLEPTGLAGSFGRDIHHEPGLWLYMGNQRTTDKDFSATEGVVDADISVARLASIPHGNSVLALGTLSVVKGKKAKPVFPHVSGLPIGRFEDLGTPGYDVNDDPYLTPYRYFIDEPFRGTHRSRPLGIPLFPLGDEFPGFSPDDMTRILDWENRNFEIEKTTILTVDSTRQHAGIANIPFVVKQAEPVSLKSTFWIQQVKERGGFGHRKMRLQYVQVLILDFFRPREDGHPGRARWPHVSINTLEKVSGF